MFGLSDRKCRQAFDILTGIVAFDISAIVIDIPTLFFLSYIFLLYVVYSVLQIDVFQVDFLL